MNEWPGRQSMDVCDSERKSHRQPLKRRKRGELARWGSGTSEPCSFEMSRWSWSAREPPSRLEGQSPQSEFLFFFVPFLLIAEWHF